MAGDLHLVLAGVPVTGAAAGDQAGAVPVGAARVGAQDTDQAGDHHGVDPVGVATVADTGTILIIITDARQVTSVLLQHVLLLQATL